MQFRKDLLIILIFLKSQLILATGLPVVDTNEVLQQLKDSVYLISTVGDLLGEMNATANDLQALIILKEELSRLGEDLKTYKDLNLEINELSNPQIHKAETIADYISQVTTYIRKLKKFVILAQSTGARPQAISAMFDMLREERERQKEQFDTAMKTYEEQEKIAHFRNQLKIKIETKKALDSEFALVARRTDNKLLKVQSRKSENNLW